MSNPDHHSEVTVTTTISREELLAAMAANKPAPRALTTTEQSAAAGSKFARPNIERQQAAVREVQPATEKQFAFIRRLLSERVGIVEAEDIRNALNNARRDGTFDKSMASAYITRLLAIKPNSAPAPEAPEEAPEAPRSGDDAWKRPNCVPDGQYALKGEDGVVRFYSVNTPEEGKWAGTCWVRQHASDERFQVKGKARHLVLDAIEADPRSAAILFGHETNHCGRCGRELTDEASRAAGVGPVCARKAGWA
jgi:Family of unknown function (DUF6011)